MPKHLGYQLGSSSHRQGFSARASSPLGRPTAQPNIGSTISGLLYCSVVCLFRFSASASASTLFCGGWDEGKVVEPKSHSLNMRGVGRCGEADCPVGADNTFSIYRDQLDPVDG
jgi:hypothetical protein